MLRDGIQQITCRGVVKKADLPLSVEYLCTFLL